MGEVIPLRAEDSLRSVVAGLGDPFRDKAASTYYGLQLLDEYQLANIYRSNWLGKKIVDIPAYDAIRKGRDWQATQDQIELIEAEEKRLGFWKKLLETLTKARLWGGAAMFIGTGDQNLSEPLNVDRVGKGGLKYLTVLSRRDVTPGPIDQNVFSEFYGRPSYYEVTGNTSFVHIHPSRLAIFIGAPLGDELIAKSVNQGWGDSILEAVYTALRNADSTAANIASLVFEANVDVFSVPDFMASLAKPEYQQRLLDRFNLAAVAKGINKSLMLDANEKYDRKQVSFNTLPEVMQSFLQMISGAADIPVTRLLGQSPAGMSATGESDMLNYYDRVSSIQSIDVTPALYRVDECLIRSALGARPPEIYFAWSPLKQMTEKEKAEIGKIHAETSEIIGRTGFFTSDEMRKVVANKLIETGYYPGLDQAMEETGDDWKPDLGGDKDDDVEGGEEKQPLEGVESPPAAALAKDAAPRTLYIHREVVNASEIKAWAKSQGFDAVMEDLHVTVIHTRTPLDWIKVGQAGERSTEDDGVMTISPGGPRMMERFGDAVVLQFASTRLTWRHEDIKRLGAQTDHPEYQPHVTITWAAPDVDLSQVEPYKGKIVLGPEMFEEVDDDWRAKITTGGSSRRDGTFR